MGEAGESSAGARAAERVGVDRPPTSLPPPFHLAFEVFDLNETERFFVDVLGCGIGRRAPRWIDFDFRGHQISAHLVERPAGDERVATNAVDGDAVPARHFGLVLPWADWEAMCDHLVRCGAPIVIGPRIRFAGEPGEQGTVFTRDPSGNAIELKSFRDPAMLFATSFEHAP